MQELLVAAGGGGDAIAAYMLASRDDRRRPLIATWAWDRLIIDPLPGPRSAVDFVGLASPTPDVSLIEATTSPIPPAGSTLPQLAAHLDAQLLLLDPADGGLGLTRQIRAAAEWSQAARITVVDVGGDAIARPGDSGLRSPMADITSVVATARTGVPADLVVIGLGCDGELPPDVIRKRLRELRAHQLASIDAAAAEVVEPILQWHPSEATALIAMAALGYRGNVEIRDQGLPVDLSADSSEVWSVEIGKAAPPDPIATAIADTTSLAELEAVFQDQYGINEIDYERRKARSLDAGSSLAAMEVSAFLAAAADRGTHWVTRRRLREATGSVPDRFTKSLLIPTT